VKKVDDTYIISSSRPNNPVKGGFHLEIREVNQGQNNHISISDIINNLGFFSESRRGI